MISIREQALSWVPRWVIVNTIQKQTVAEHSFYVALLADRIATILGIPVDDFKLRYRLQRAALTHDMFESISGDLPSPYKRCISDDAAYSKYRHLFEEEIPVDEIEYKIIKIADLMEALIFLEREKSLGNTSILDVYFEIHAKLRAACMEFGEDVWLRIDAEYHTVCYFQDPL